MTAARSPSRGGHVCGVSGVPIRRYSVFSGRVIDRQAESWGRTPHYHILLEGGGQRFRVAVNTRSGTSHSRKSDLLYFADDDFRHEITRRLATVDDGEHHVESRPGGLALDYQRGGLFDRRHMRRIPASLPGPRNDLRRRARFLRRALARRPDQPAPRLRYALGSGASHAGPGVRLQTRQRHPRRPHEPGQPRRALA